MNIYLVGMLYSLVNSNDSQLLNMFKCYVLHFNYLPKHAGQILFLEVLKLSIFLYKLVESISQALY